MLKTQIDGVQSSPYDTILLLIAPMAVPTNTVADQCNHVSSIIMY